MTELTESILFQVIAILGTITGFGIALDRIFITSHIRERIEEYLTLPRSKGTWFDGYKEILGLSEAIVFDRYFSGNIVGWRFLKSSLFVSAASFLAAISIQYIFFPEFVPQFVLSPSQVSVIAAFFLFNAFMDVVTIAQTRAFIRASVSSDRPFNSIIFFGSDIIVTLNIFILTYAAFLLVLVQFFTLPTVRSSVRITADAWIEAGGEIYNNADFSERLRETQVFYSLSVPEREAQSSFGVLSTDAVTPLEALYLLQYLYGGSLQIGSIEPSLADDVESIVGSGLQLALLRGADRTTALSDPEAFPDYDQSGTELLPRRVVDLELNLTGVKPNFSNLDSIYTPAFNTVDALEDNFPYSMFNSTGWVSMEGFIEAYSRSQLTGPLLSIVLCEKSGGYTFSTQADNRIDEATAETFAADCDQIYIVRNSDWVSNLQTLASFGRGASVFLPFSAMFVTSLLPTFLLYLVLIGVTASTSIHRIIIGRAARLGDFIVQQPIGFFCFLLGLVIISYRLIF